MKAGGKQKEQERARQSDKVTSCPCTVNRVCSVSPSPWRLKHRPDKNATGHRPPSLPSPPLSSSLSAPLARYVPPPSLSIFTLYSPNTHSPSFLPHQPDKNPTTLSVSPSRSLPNATALLIRTPSSHAPSS